MNKKINKAMLAPESYVLRIRYRDKDGALTERIVSPIRYINHDSILAMCLCREEPRRFYLSQVEHSEIVDANDVLMPVEIKVLEEASNPPADAA